MGTLTFVLLLLTALLAGYGVLLAGLHALYGRGGPSRDLHLVRVGGGWQAALHRVRPATGTAPRSTPVILAHGMSMCRRFWDPTPETSMARYLSERGHDVWIAEYRGDESARFSGAGDPWDYSIDHHILEDAPELIEHVCERTGSPQVDWVGHSMGGIIAYGYIQAFGSSRIRRLITIGSPARVSATRGLLKVPRVVTAVFLRPRRVWLGELARFGLPFPVYLKSWLMPRFANPAVATHGEIATILSRGVMNLSSRLLRQFDRWQLDGSMLLDDGSARLEDAAEQIDVPLLVLAGHRDFLVRPRFTEYAFANAPTDHKRLRVYGSPGDPAPPFGHLDLVASAAAREHVFPEVADWLERAFD